MRVASSSKSWRSHDPAILIVLYGGVVHWGKEKTPLGGLIGLYGELARVIWGRWKWWLYSGWIFGRIKVELVGCKLAMAALERKLASNR